MKNSLKVAEVEVALVSKPRPSREEGFGSGWKGAWVRAASLAGPCTIFQFTNRRLLCGPPLTHLWMRGGVAVPPVVLTLPLLCNKL